MKNIINPIKIGIACIVIAFSNSCTDRITFQDEGALEIPQVENTSARYLWIGPDYKLVVEAVIKDNDALSSVQTLNSEWQVNKTTSISGKQLIMNDTFPVTKDANNTKHKVELVIKNDRGGVLRTTIEVEDLSGTNQIEGYTPDLLPPVITVTAPAVNRFYGINPAPIPIDVEASVTEENAMSGIYVKVWGESVDGTYFQMEDSWTPSTEEEKQAYTYRKHLEIPGGIVGEYQFLIRATDESGNQATTGGNLVVGMMDRLYLSDAKNEQEVTGQGFDAYASADAWGIGTLLPMRKIGNNLFTLNYYYRNDDDENIRFIAFMGNDRPFNTSPRGIRYTLNGENVVAHASSGKVTADMSSADFKLPVSRKGYYTITVDMTARTITAIPYEPTNPDFANAALFPGFSPANPYGYLAIIAGGSVAGTAGWAEIDNNTSLYKETGHDFLYSGAFTTVGGVNISFQAPKASLSGNTGWFRLSAARANMKDTYGDLISEIKPVGASGNGANYGISLSGNKNYYATYDLITYRLRIVQVP
ncbi:MAG: DUF4625 domain-containing protein [Dysgonamonadaceae bacterium]|jgi:hypothetical protein|nr:DUF4625 domain-containing protein [Dysgonamonadaceae bacterium]